MFEKRFFIALYKNIFSEDICADRFFASAFRWRLYQNKLDLVCKTKENLEENT